jgi:trehalose 6-phosphate phosphatase
VTQTRGCDLPGARDAATVFANLDPRTIALLLDFDGTLVDIAPTPQDVHVPASLRGTLERLLIRMGGALALVSGRPIADLDRLFSPLQLPAIGGHGAEVRVGNEHVSAKPLLEELRRRLAAAKAIDAGIVIEDKQYSVALHYRKAPQREDELRRHIAEVCSIFLAEPIEVLRGKAMFEVKRPGVSKGEAVRALMKRVPFQSRRPVFIGDDVTDETVFALLPALGGLGFSVQQPFDQTSGIFHSPETVRRALDALASR